MATNFEARADKQVARSGWQALVWLIPKEACQPRQHSDPGRPRPRFPIVWLLGRSLPQSSRCLERDSKGQGAWLHQALRETPSSGHNRSQAQIAGFIQWSCQSHGHPRGIWLLIFKAVSQLLCCPNSSQQNPNKKTLNYIYLGKMYNDLSRGHPKIWFRGRESPRNARNIQV